MTVSGSPDHPERTTHVVPGLGWPGDDDGPVETERLGGVDAGVRVIDEPWLDHPVRVVAVRRRGKA